MWNVTSAFSPGCGLDVLEDLLLVVDEEVAFLVGGMRDGWHVRLAFSLASRPSAGVASDVATMASAIMFAVNARGQNPVNQVSSLQSIGL